MPKAAQAHQAKQTAEAAAGGAPPVDGAADAGTGAASGDNLVDGQELHDLIFTDPDPTKLFDPHKLLTTDTLIQFVLIACIIFLSLILSKRLRDRGFLNGFKAGNFRNWAGKVLNPALQTVFLVMASIVVQKVHGGGKPIFIVFVNYVTAWLIVFRTLTSLLRYVLPKRLYTMKVEQNVTMVLWVFFLLWVSGWWEKFTDLLKNVTFTLGSSKLSLFLMLNAVFWVILVIFVSLWLSKLIESRLMRFGGITMNIRIVLNKVIKFMLLFLAIVITLPLIGIDLTILSVFGGALGVGIGFGLQKIASNYISGFIILLDRSVRVGDRLNIGDFTGYVTQITGRYVVLKNTVGQEALIPNESFISNKVINESFTDAKLWRSLAVSVAYNTDLPRALEIMKEAVACQEGVNLDTPPNAFVTDFADSAIVLTVGFWVSNPENGFMGINSRIYLEIWRRFKDEGIEFPFPQREVRILNQTGGQGFADEVPPPSGASGSPDGDARLPDRAAAPPGIAPADRDPLQSPSPTLPNNAANDSVGKPDRNA